MLRRMMALMIIAALLTCSVFAAAEGIGTGEEAVKKAIAAAGGDVDAYRKVYIDEDDENGAWAFCAKTVGAVFSGEFWYVNAHNAVKLGEADNIFGWGVLHCKPCLYYCSFGKSAGRKPVKVFRQVDGMPEKVDLPVELVHIETLGRNVVGMTEAGDYDYRVFRWLDDKIEEVLPVASDPAALNGIHSNFEDILTTLERRIESFELVSCVYYETGLIAVNYRMGGDPWHIYFYEDGDKWVSDMTWENEPVAYEGFCGSSD